MPIWRIKTKGSVPRDAVVKIVVWSDGWTLGGMGDGESEVIIKSADVIRDGGGTLADVDMTGDTSYDEGMVCGGTMKLIIEKYQ